MTFSPDNPPLKLPAESGLIALATLPLIYGSRARMQMVARSETVIAPNNIFFQRVCQRRCGTHTGGREHQRTRACESAPPPLGLPETQPSYA